MHRFLGRGRSWTQFTYECSNWWWWRLWVLSMIIRKVYVKNKNVRFFSVFKISNLAVSRGFVSCTTRSCVISTLLAQPDSTIAWELIHEYIKHLVTIFQWLHLHPSKPLMSTTILWYLLFDLVLSVTDTPILLQAMRNINRFTTYLNRNSWWWLIYFLVVFMLTWDTWSWSSRLGHMRYLYKSFHHLIESKSTLSLLLSLGPGYQIKLSSINIFTLVDLFHTIYIYGKFYNHLLKASSLSVVVFCRNEPLVFLLQLDFILICFWLPLQTS